MAFIDHVAALPSRSRPGDVPPCPVCAAPAPALPQYRPLALHGCPDCGLAFAPERSESSIRALYATDYFERYGAQRRAYDADEAGRRREAAVRVRLLRAHVPPGQVLEIGSASGHFLDAARRAGYEALGVEPEAGIARRARDRLGVAVLTGFLEDVELPAGSQDAVCAWHVVEHLPRPLDALRRMRELLRPGGHVLLEVPNLHSAAARREVRDWACLDPEHHVCHFGPASLRRAATLAGLEVVGTQTVSWFAYLPWRRALRPRVLGQRVRHSMRNRVPLRTEHPDTHELLRLVARRPIQAGSHPPAAAGRPA